MVGILDIVGIEAWVDSKVFSVCSRGSRDSRVIWGSRGS